MNAAVKTGPVFGGITDKRPWSDWGHRLVAHGPVSADMAALLGMEAGTFYFVVVTPGLQGSTAREHGHGTREAAYAAGVKWGAAHGLVLGADGVTFVARAVEQSKIGRAA